MPASFYRSRELYERSRDEIFAKSWQFIGHTDDFFPADEPGLNVAPVTILEGCLNEPCILIKDEKTSALNLHSNVCTHRGSVLVEKSCQVETMRCRYHGRRFGLDGCMVSAPGFEEAENFPTEQDNLAKLPMESWDKFLFAAIDPAFSLDDLIRDMKERLDFLPLQDFKFSPELSKDYFVNANWALYCDNYLEGMHVPYVHPSLATLLDIRDYRTELLPYGNLQIGTASKPEDAFELPEGHRDHGQQIAAYYYWFYPNMMFNFYPWGLSINIVRPQSPGKTRVSFYTYVWKEESFNKGAGAGLDTVEMEDEEVVEAVQKGIRSRYYQSGRYSVTREQGIHHFQRMIAERMG